MKKIFEKTRKIDLVLAFVVAIYFFYIFFKHTINIPLNDDYDVINNFNDILDANSLIDKIKLFYLQHNEHRILYDKFWFYISYWINEDGLNLNFLSFIGNLSLVALVVFYYLKLRKEYSNYYLLFPLSVLLLNIAFWENITFSMACLSNFTFVVFALLSLHYITKKEVNNKDLLLSVFFLLLSVLTQGGGILVFPIALLVLTLKQNKRIFLKYLFFALCVVVLYFIDYDKHPSPGLIEIAANTFQYFKFFLLFLGSSIANYHFFPDNNDAAMLRSYTLGILFFTFFIYILIKKYYKQNLFNFSVISLVVLISVVTSISRLSQGISTATASRYRLISILFLISILIYLLELFKQKKIKNLYANSILILISSAYLFFFNFNGTNESLMSYRKRISMFGMLNYFSNDTSLLNSTKTTFCAEVLKRSNDSEVLMLNENEINKYYTFASAIEFKDFNFENPIIDASRIENVKPLKDSYYIDGFAALKDLNTKNQNIYIVLSNNGKKTAFLAVNEFRPGLSTYFDIQNMDYGGFFVRIKKEDISNGKNDIEILIQNGDAKKRIKTDKSLIKE